VPLAAASLAQVHSAKLKNGDEVVIKVLRPELRKELKKIYDF
jgi:ubiquinone biosynthesis protein